MIYDNEQFKLDVCKIEEDKIVITDFILMDKFNFETGKMLELKIVKPDEPCPKFKEPLKPWNCLIFYKN